MTLAGAPASPGEQQAAGEHRDAVAFDLEADRRGPCAKLRELDPKLRCCALLDEARLHVDVPDGRFREQQGEQRR